MFLPGNHNLQMSSCLSSGGRAYAFELEIIKSPSPASTATTARASNAAASASAAAASSSSSPSSTLSESSNSGLAITTRKPRTPRKRPNQTYNEAAALLATAYPNLFPAAATTNTSKLAKSTSDAASSSSLSDDSAELFFPFRGVVDDEYSSSFLLLPERLNTRFRPKLSCASPGEIESRPSCHSGAVELSCEYHDGEDFDADSMLDEEVDEGGIDSIMGNLSVKSEPPAAASAGATTCYGYPMGLGLGLGLGLGVGIGVRALRRADEGNWWSFPAVDMVELSPRLRKPAEKGNGAKKKKMKKVEREKAEVVIAAVAAEPPSRVAVAEEKEAAGLLLKLNYDGVLNAWSDKGSPFSDEAPGQDAQGNDVAARLAQIDLFPAESGGVREASVLRYKEKRRTRLFSKKIRYQVRKVNADRRPRMKGRFVRRPNSKHDDYDER